MSTRSSEAILSSMGAYGSEIVTAGSSTTGPFCALHFVTANSLSAYTAPVATGTFTGITYPAGFILYGRCTAFTAAGTVVAYRGDQL